MSTESTYKYHMQVQENVASESSLQQPHKATLPLKQLLKPRAGHRGTSETDGSTEGDHLVNSDQANDALLSSRCIQSVIVHVAVMIG